MKCIIAASRHGYDHFPASLAQLTGHSFQLVTTPDALTIETLAEIQPDIIFFPHWSHIISSSIYKKYECIMFHMTDLPFGRGGSPLQNLLSRGIYQTKMTAFRCAQGIDTGPVYLKSDFSLEGTAKEIYQRATLLVEEMIKEIIETRPTPSAQVGEPITFRRRKPGQSNIADLEELTQIYDYIRMLDAEGYPHAFIETTHFRLEFTQAMHNLDSIEARVSIKRKSHE